MDYPYEPPQDDNDPAQRPTENYTEYLRRRLAAKAKAGQTEPLISAMTDDEDDFNEAITETVDHWVEDWLSPGAAEHAQIIYTDWLRS